MPIQPVSNVVNQNAYQSHLQPDRLLRLKQVMDIVALGKTMIYRLISEGRFPKPLKPCSNASRWSEGEVYAWVAGQCSRRQ
ncbi:AlpA family phage regulatory protein [Novosphingobium sp. FSY-8]|uniref:AlpA family phage regulatory protein n=1 Tax=Novosphingobium ovatum TaxID=1908523 RepID=A0ABW9XGY4_9SPHN|nr:AlpA family phage regulatory protein [Novosphingobium ovatum]NBC37812.1 AlpA family phage regulatory protein [Novosphingobium ovatum]